jgi:hypothetical protein
VFSGPLVGKVSWESGGVVDYDSGRALVGARVSLSIPTLAQPLRAVTDTRGQYAFLNIPLGRRRCVPAILRVHAAGYKSITVGPEGTVRGAGQRSVEISKRRDLSESDTGCRRP